MAALFLCLGYQLEKPLVLAIHFHGVIPSEAEFPEDAYQTLLIQGITSKQ